MANTLLYIVANPNEESKSYSRSVGRAFVDAYKAEHPDDTVIEIDLYQIEIPFLDAHIFSAWGKLRTGIVEEDLPAFEKAQVTSFNLFTDEFIKADRYVFVNPLWNLGGPPKLKAYLDTICIAGKTFRYTEQGKPEGLLKGKKALHIMSAGGIYSEGPNAPFEFASTYLRKLMIFLGVEDFTSLFVEGIEFMPDKADEIKQNAITRAQTIAKDF